MGALTDRGAPTPLVDWAVASRSHPDQTESGDRHVVAPFACGVLLGAVDGLGHGVAAAVAARAAVALLEAQRGESPVDLVRSCHAALTTTRGVVMSVASIDARERTLPWLGIGNVEGVVLRADRVAQPCRQTLLLRAGVVGYRLPELHASVLRVSPGDTLIFATDGIRGDFCAQLVPGEPPGRTADRILAEHARAPDDALVLVARFLGAGT
jgi:negative regulator of sigma-B (phosphoserine phosphatase)